MDYQNAYRRARTCFGLAGAVSPAGQFRPERLGRLLAADGPVPRVLTAVRVYRGEPSPTRDPRGHAAAQRQVASWRRDPIVTVVTRPYQYLPGGVVREKGIDVLLALDLAEGAWRGAFDVAVVVSAEQRPRARRRPRARGRHGVRGGGVAQPDVPFAARRPGSGRALPRAGAGARRAGGRPARLDAAARHVTC